MSEGGNAISKRKAQDLTVPDPGEDPSERKRVLNVLAQRRYRQRRKAHIQKLEAQAEISETPKSPEQKKASPREAARILPYVQEHSRQSDAPFRPFSGHEDPQSSYFHQQPYDQPASDSQPFTNANRGQSQFPQSDLFADFDPSIVQAFPENDDCAWDPSVLLPSLPSTPLSSTTHSSSSSEGATWSLTSIEFAEPSPRHVLLGGSASASHGASPVQHIPREQPCDFPDEAHLPILELNLLRGAMSIAHRLNISDIIWSLTALSPFSDPSNGLASYDHLPVNLQPTAVQMTVPHHPLIDLMPWPTVRDKLILVFSQPAEVRPPSAAHPTALLDFVYDVEDPAEGVRISGSDPYSDRNWEVGEKVFKGWWWAFDREVIQRSNELRLNRGATMLGMGHVLGEVL